MKKYLFFFLVIVSFILFLNYYSIKHLATQDGFISNKIRHNTPQIVKNYLKKINHHFSEKIFIFKNYEQKKEEVQKLKQHKLVILDKINILDLQPNGQFIPDGTNLKISKFKNNLFFEMGVRGYLAKDEKNIYIITGMGNLFYIQNKDILNKKELILKKINTNFYNLAILGSNNTYHRNIVKNVLVKNDKIYVSYYKKNNENCFFNSVLVGDLKHDGIEFKQFFETNECQPFYDDNTAVGGNLADYKKNSILMTIGGWDSYVRQKNNNPQNIKSLIGKIISIDILTKKAEIISMGHRNSQGLFYDKQNNVIYSTDHGPEGGDEINQHINPEVNDVKNFGWAISSYGEHYLSEEKWRNEDLYKRAPLNKSHQKFGFEEPIKYFTPAIGITQILKKNSFNNNIENENRLYVGSMGWDLSEGDLGLHEIILDEELKFKTSNFIPIGERVRDFLFLEDLKIFVIFLESDASIGILQEM